MSGRGWWWGCRELSCNFKPGGWCQWNSGWLYLVFFFFPVVAIVSVVEVHLWWLTSTVHACSEGLQSIQFAIENGRQKADHCSLLTVWDITVICQEENKRKTNKKKNLWQFSWARVWQVLVWWMRRLRFFLFFFLLQSTRDRERPIAINADQPKPLPEQQTDRMQSRRGVDFFPHVLCVCVCAFVALYKEDRGNVHMGQGGKKRVMAAKQKISILSFNIFTLMWLFLRKTCHMKVNWPASSVVKTRPQPLSHILFSPETHTHYWWLCPLCFSLSPSLSFKTNSKSSSVVMQAHQVFKKICRLWR